MRFKLALVFALFLFLSTPSHSQVEYSCSDISWLENPHYEGNRLKGKLQISCLFRAASGGGFSQLKAHELDLMHKNATEIHSGPTYSSHQGLPSEQYDVDMKLQGAGTNLMARGDFILAMDDENKFIKDFFSANVMGTGLSAVVKKMDSGYMVESIGEPEWYDLKFTHYGEFEKPPIISQDDFRNQVVQKTEEEIEASLEANVTDIAENI